MVGQTAKKLIGLRSTWVDITSWTEYALWRLHLYQYVHYSIHTLVLELWFRYSHENLVSRWWPSTQTWRFQTMHTINVYAFFIRCSNQHISLYIYPATRCIDIAIAVISRSLYFTTGEKRFSPRLQSMTNKNYHGLTTWSFETVHGYEFLYGLMIKITVQSWACAYIHLSLMYDG